MDKVNVLFVCLGNICRSPTAHGVMESLVRQHGLEGQIGVDSCGTGAWHIGQPPDERTLQVARNRGYDFSHQRARRLGREDFDRFHYILAMDTRNLADVIGKAPADYSGRIQLFLDYHPERSLLEVPDPYYGGTEGFERVFTLVEETCQHLLDHIRKTL